MTYFTNSLHQMSVSPTGGSAPQRQGLLSALLTVPSIYYNMYSLQEFYKYLGINKQMSEQGFAL